MKKGMKNVSLTVFAVFLCLLFSVTSGFANEGAGKVSIGLMATSFSYAEFSHKQIIDKDNGGIFGLQVEGEYVFPENVWVRGVGSWQTGTNIVYRGQYLDGTPAVGHKAQHFVWNIEGDVGYVFESNTFVLIPYTGLGYRYWHRGKTKDLTGDYVEKYSWGYIPIGLKTTYMGYSKDFTIGVDAALTLPFGMHMKDEYGYKFDLGWRPGFKVSMPISYNLGKIINTPLSLGITPYYEYWAIRDSNVVSGFYEPASTTNQVGIIWGVSYLF